MNDGVVGLSLRRLDEVDLCFCIEGLPPLSRVPPSEPSHRLLQSAINSRRCGLAPQDDTSLLLDYHSVIFAAKYSRVPSTRPCSVEWNNGMKQCMMATRSKMLLCRALREESIGDDSGYRTLPMKRANKKNRQERCIQVYPMTGKVIKSVDP
jgi:hypothetical protein